MVSQKECNYSGSKGPKCAGARMDIIYIGLCMCNNITLYSGGPDYVDLLGRKNLLQDGTTPDKGTVCS